MSVAVAVPIAEASSTAVIVAVFFTLLLLIQAGLSVGDAAEEGMVDEYPQTAVAICGVEGRVVCSCSFHRLAFVRN